MSEPSVTSRCGGMHEFVAHPWASCPAYGHGGLAERLHIGGGVYDHVAPGFEYCLDAPMRIPAGSHRAPSVQPYWD